MSLPLATDSMGNTLLELVAASAIELGSAALTTPCPLALVVVADASSGEVLFGLNRWRHTYELPGGMVERGESIHEAAVRELEEETGVGAAPLTLIGYARFALVNPEREELGAVYSTRVAKKEARSGEELVALTWRTPMHSSSLAISPLDDAIAEWAIALHPATAISTPRLPSARPMMPPRVREGVIDDADAVAAVHVRSWQAAYRGLIDQPFLDALSTVDRAETWRRFVADPLPTSLGILVAERDGTILGWASFGSDRDADASDPAPAGEIYAVYADPDAWSQGVGHALLDEAERRLTDAGHTRAHLWVLDGNDRADAFYARHGWAADGTSKVDDRPGLTLTEHRRVKHLGSDSPAETTS